MAKRKTDDRTALPDPAHMTYEQAIAELEAINQRIESGELGLEESLVQYRRGIALSQRCGQILDAAEQELKILKPADLAREAASSREPDEDDADESDDDLSDDSED